MHILIVAVIIGLIIIVILSFMVNRRILYERYMTVLYTPENLGCNIDPNAVKEGLEYFKTKKIIICALLRDSADSIDLDKKNLAKLATIFKDYRVLIVENDSKDNTRSILLEWVKNDPKVTILGCGVNSSECHINLPKTIVHSHDEPRIKKMVLLRNIYQDYIANNSELFNDFDFTVVWDMDIIGTFYVDGIASSGYIFNKQPEVNSLCANGIRVSNLGILTLITYADPFAHEEPGNTDKTIRGPTNLWMLWPDKCDSSNDIYKVVSCFNGFAIYRKPILDGKKYILEHDENNPGDVLCEHTTLHRQMDGMYMNKKMIFVILRQ